MRRVLLVDDHQLFRSGLRGLLEGGGIARVTGEAGSGVEMLEMLSAMAANEVSGGTERNPEGFSGAAGLPDVVLLDIDMPVMDGRQAAAQALSRWPELRIVTLSMHGDEHYYFAMVEAGVQGFLLKSSGMDEVAAAIDTVAEGGTYFSPELLQGLVSILRTTAPLNGVSSSDDDVLHADVSSDDALSDREREVLLCVCGGLSNQEIADKLFISKRTVDKHRANIMLKTGNKNTANLVVYAIKNGLVEI